MADFPALPPKASGSADGRPRRPDRFTFPATQHPAVSPDGPSSNDRTAPSRPPGLPPRHPAALVLPGATARTPVPPKPVCLLPGGATWPLPTDDTIAAVARRHSVAELGALRVSEETVDDVVMMVSELATNVVQHAARCPDGRMRPAAEAELWMYRRTAGPGHRELMVSVFDRSPHHPRRSPREATDLYAEGGRGLMLVEAMTGGRWGSYPTRSRLANLPGKVTWFAVPLPETEPRETEPWEQDPVEAGGILEALLARRGFGGLLLRSCPDSGLSVLSVTTGLTVWCRAGHFCWRALGRDRRAPFGDLTAVAEEIVSLHATAGSAGTPA